MNLSDYQIDTLALLRDSNSLFTNPQQLIRYINQARQEVAKRTGCINVLIPGQAPYGNSAVPGQMIPGGGQPGSAAVSTFQTIPGVEKYSYGFANPYLRQWNAGVKSIIDVISIGVSWGGIRPSLDWMPYEDLQAYARSYNVGTLAYPFLWSSNGDGERGHVWLWPIPSIDTALAAQTNGSAGEMEWQVTAMPLDIYSNNDYEALPEPFQQEVKYYAAYLAYLGQQRPLMAAGMLDLFTDHLGLDRVASDRGKTSSFYPSVP